MSVIAIVGATGAVGREFIRVLRERPVGASQWRYLASPRSAGARIEGVEGEAEVAPLTREALRGVQVAFFSAGGATSREFAPAARDAGAVVIDNSSAFRMAPDVPLVVPEVNPQAARAHRGIIANPNCSTIIMAVVLAPLHRANPMRRVVVSTYQAVSGAGARAIGELERQTREVLAGQQPRCEVFHEPCAFNVFSHDSQVGPDGYNAEETKMIAETHKIFGDASIGVAPTCVRVPVMRAHTEALSIEFTRPIDPDAARQLLAQAPGVRIVDDPRGNRFPTPLDASGQDDVLVGRIRRDPSIDGGRGLQLLCAGDQLRKGAALNAVQIAELLR